MKVSSVFIVAAAIVTGQASAQRAITGRRPGTKQRKALKGEVRRLQKNDASSLSRSQSEHSGSKEHTKKSKSTSRSGKGETCSIEDLIGSTYTPWVDFASLGLTQMWTPGFGYLINNLPVTLTFKRLGKVGLPGFSPPSVPLRRLKGSVDVNFCLAHFPFKLVVVQTGFTNDGIVPFTLMPIFIPPGYGDTDAFNGTSSVSDASAGSIDEKPDENGQGERRTEGFPEEYPELAEILGAKGDNNGDAEKMEILLLRLSQFAIYGEYNCKNRQIMFGGGAGALGISFAIIDPAEHRSTWWLNKNNRLDGNGCFIPRGSRDEQRDADWD